MKKILLLILLIFNMSMVMCNSNNISENDINEMKEVVDKVLSYDKAYNDEINDYIDKETFNNSNYVIFYSYYIGDVVLNKYESEVRGVSKEDDQYNLCMIINMEAKATTIETDGEEQGYDTAEGNDVPIEVILVKKKGSFYIKSVKEYDSLDIAQNENKNFIKK